MTYLIKFDNLRVNACLSVIVNKVSKSNTLANMSHNLIRISKSNNGKYILQSNYRVTERSRKFIKYKTKKVDSN